MNESDDPILRRQESLSTEGAEYLFVSLPQSTIEVVDACIYTLWVMKKFNKSTRPLEIITNAQKMFASEEVKLNDKFWKEHCASSLRELVDGQLEADGLWLYKLVPRRNNSEEERTLCEQVQLHKDFLNDFAHFKTSATTKAQEIMNDRSFNEVDEDIFDRICSSFVNSLEQFFKFGVKTS